MANRYRYTRTTTDTDTNKSYYTTTIYPKIKPSDLDLYVVTEAGDRIDLLAKKYYNDSSLWWIIATANNINDANFYVPEGVQLRIPNDLQRIVSDLEKINR